MMIVPDIDAINNIINVEAGTVLRGKGVLAGLQGCFGLLEVRE